MFLPPNPGEGFPRRYVTEGGTEISTSFFIFTPTLKPTHIHTQAMHSHREVCMGQPGGSESSVGMAGRGGVPVKASDTVGQRQAFPVVPSEFPTNTIRENKWLLLVFFKDIIDFF